MISSILLLLAIQAPATIPSPPAGIGPYQGRVAPPPPLVLNEIEQEMWNTFGAARILMLTTCNSPDFEVHTRTTGERLQQLNERLAKAVDRARGSRIVHDSFADLKHASLPGCPAPDEVERRFLNYEKSMDALDAALKRAGH